MSLKENVDYVKKEISTEETFLESFLKLENFYKKYKMAIFGTVGVAIIAVIGLNVKSYMDEQNLIASNEAFNIVLNDPNNKEALDTLQSTNKKLYALAMYKNDQSKAIELDFFKELQTYFEAIKAQDTNQISSATQSQKFLLKDFAIFNKALIEAKNGQYNKSKESLKLISQTSDIASLVKMLEHHLATK